MAHSPEQPKPAHDADLDHDGAPSPGGSGAAPHPPPELEPLSLSLLGRLFGVPLVIIGAIVGGAVVVVLLFGGPAQPERRSVDELLQVLDANSGERSFHMILPKEKELWQAALELSQRLQDGNGGVESARIALRLAGMVHDELAAIHKMPVGQAEDERRRELRRGRLLFMIHALGRTNTPDAVDPLMEIVRGGEEPFRSVAMQELGNLHNTAGARRAVDPIRSVLDSGGDARTMLTAATVLSVLAEPSDSAVIDALARAHVAAAGEVSWSAALALARLGSAKGKATLLDLLDRSFWESADRYEVGDASDRVRRYPLPPARVEALLIAAIDAASCLDDADLWGMIERVQSDRSLAVQGAATRALQRRPRG